MENNEKKSNGLLIGLVVFLIIAVLGLGGYIIYDKVIDKDEPKIEENSNVDETNEEETKENNDNSKKNDKVESSTYKPKCIKTGDSSVYTTDVDTTMYKNIFEYIYAQSDVSISMKYYKTEATGLNEKKYLFTDEEMETFFKERKEISLDYKALGGMGSPYLIINYTRGGKEYYLNIYEFFVIFETNDGNIYKIMDEHVDEIDEARNANNLCIYRVKNSSIVDEIYNSK